ncbi:MAG: RIP metalloprotease RseP [Bacteroidales bacterium]|nr:RIP metalloprotease RseP [Bacteroidales bacterium]
MGVIIQISQLLLSLSILVILHELGHFIFARLFNTRVEKFYLFFDPWFSIFKVKKGETEYGIGWLPLGGYVKIAGMIDESMDKEQLKKPPQPYEFRSKPTGQRLLIMLGGVIVNLVLGFIIYTGVLYAWGEQYLPNKNLTDGIWCVDSLANEIGFETGDRIISINGIEPERFDDIFREVIFGGTVTVLRNNEPVTFIVPKEFIGDLVEERNVTLFYPRVPFIIREIPDTSINKGSGLQPKDQVTGINGMPFKYYDQYLTIVDTLKPGTLRLEVLRGSETLSLDAILSPDKKIEVFSLIPSFDELDKLNYIQLETRSFNLLQAIPAGFQLAGDRLSFYIKQFKLIFNFKTGAYKGLGGFGTIGGLFPRVWEWQYFWEITAFLSLILAFMNILPIPALDGGHVTFLLYEVVTRRKPSEKFLEYAQIVGMIIILGLLIYANTNDIMRWIEGLIDK